MWVERPTGAGFWRVQWQGQTYNVLVHEKETGALSGVEISDAGVFSSQMFFPESMPGAEWRRVYLSLHRPEFVQKLRNSLRWLIAQMRYWQKGSGEPPRCANCTDEWPCSNTETCAVGRAIVLAGECDE